MKEAITSPTSTEPVVYTLEEAATLLKVSKWTLARLIEEGQLSSILIRSRRLVRSTDLNEFLERQRTASVWSRNA